MITRFFARLYAAFLRGLALVRTHRDFAYTIALVVLVPCAFLFSGQQFLDVAKEHHMRAEYARIGLLHDAVAAYVLRSGASEAPALLHTIAQENPDLLYSALATHHGAKTDLYVLSGTSTDDTQYADLYTLAAARIDESFVFERTDGSGHSRVGVRAFLGADGGTTHFLVTVFSADAVDALYVARVRMAYLYMAVIVFALVLLMIRHARSINYAQLYNELEMALAAKTQFINMTAHELRAPLSALRGYASMISERGDVPLEAHGYAKRIEESAGYMVRLVSDMLDVAKIESGGLTLAQETVRVADVYAVLIERLLPLAREHGLTLTTEVTDPSLSMVVDRTRLEQILTNLISNALKYTREGGVTLAASLVHGKCELRIKDTGTGMTAEDQHKLFSPYFRTEDAEASKEMGTGLGMWITKQFIEKMGGAIAVESIRGVGTHVVVAFPYTHG